MNKLYSVRIIRREDQIVQGIYIKEFFMLSGVYVDEFVLGYDKFKEDNDYVDFNIVLEDGDYLNKLKARDTINIIDDSNEKIDLSSMNKRITYGRKIEKKLMKIRKKLDWNKEWKRDFGIIYDAFVESDFAYNDYLTHIFLEQFSDDMKLIQLESLDKCYSMIYNNEFMNKFRMSECLPQRKFAYLNCARKINKINEALYDKPVFNVQKMSGTLARMTYEDEKFTMALVLSSLVEVKLPKNDKYIMEGLDASNILKVLEKEGTNRYSAFIYYILANYYEGYGNGWNRDYSKLYYWERNDNLINYSAIDMKKALRLYRDMKELTPRNYKMLFKLAMKDMNEHDDEKFFREISQVFELAKAKVKNGWATPDDLEYYYLSEELLEGISRDGSSSSTQSRSMNENMEALKNEFVKSNFMKNFIFNNNFQHIYESYFDAKIQKMSKRSKWELKMKKGEYWEHLCIFRSLKKR